jgi:hypothetical protein
MLKNMDDRVTVFRSADASAEEDATAVAELLADEGIAATIFGPDQPGVMEGVWEVRVAPADSARADAAIAAHPLEDEFADDDPSHDLDLESVMENASEMDAKTVKNLLEANGIYAIVVGDDRYPNFPQQVRVAKEHVTRAKRLIAAALAAGPAGADEAESASEQ